HHVCGVAREDGAHHSVKENGAPILGGWRRRRLSPARFSCASAPRVSAALACVRKSAGDQKLNASMLRGKYCAAPDAGRALDLPMARPIIYLGAANVHRSTRP